MTRGSCRPPRNHAVARRDRPRSPASTRTRLRPARCRPQRRTPLSGPGRRGRPQGTARGGRADDPGDARRGQRSPPDAAHTPAFSPAAISCWAANRRPSIWSSSVSSCSMLTVLGRGVEDLAPVFDRRDGSMPCQNRWLAGPVAGRSGGPRAWWLICGSLDPGPAGVRMCEPALGFLLSRVTVGGPGRRGRPGAVRDAGCGLLIGTAGFSRSARCRPSPWPAARGWRRRSGAV
jgi:hypothetical protein